MNYRRLGRTNLDVSVVAFGTCQLRLVPEAQAINTLLKGFELGSTWFTPPRTTKGRTTWWPGR
jgi:aryl-alcohol dehydrogenase-like predicted oxidoreductase